MKPNEWLDRLGSIDPQYIEEADPAAHMPVAATAPRKRHPINRRRLWPIAVAACLCVALLLTLPIWLIRDDQPDHNHGNDPQNYPYSSQFPGMLENASNYDHVFEKMNYYLYGGMTNGDVWYDNAEIVLPEGSIGNEGDEGVSGGTDFVVGDSSYNTATPGGNGYVEVTDNQVAGVIEADRIKRTNTHIFYLRYTVLNGPILEAYSILGEDSALAGTYTFPSDLRWVSDFYLSADGRTVTALAQYAGNAGNPQTAVISLDVSDPANIVEKGRITVSGTVNTSRMSGGRLLLVINYSANYNKLDASKPETFIPQTDTGDGATCIPPSDIWVPESDEMSSSSFTVLLSIHESDLTVTDTKAFLSYNSGLYVTADTIYLNNTCYASGVCYNQILGVAYKDGTFGYRGQAQVDGRLLNQYSLDEYKGILRLVTTVTHEGRANASLFCIDLETWKTVASVENFAPAGEDVRSVRFDGDMAYVCTAIRQSDPVFYFDLSDLTHITVKDTGEIAGFSTSLIQLGDGYLMGIGSDNIGFKIEVYKETETAVESVAVYRLFGEGYSYMASNYKSYLINRDKGLFGFSYTSLVLTPDPNDQGLSFYALLQFDQETETLKEVVKQSLTPYQELNFTRAVLIDEYLYVFAGQEDFFVIKVENI